MGRKPLTKQCFGPPQEEAVRVFLVAIVAPEHIPAHTAKALIPSPIERGH